MLPPTPALAIRLPLIQLNFRIRHSHPYAGVRAASQCVRMLSTQRPFSLAAPHLTRCRSEGCTAAVSQGRAGVAPPRTPVLWRSRILKRRDLLHTRHHEQGESPVILLLTKPSGHAPAASSPAARPPSRQTAERLLLRARANAATRGFNHRWAARDGARRRGGAALGSRRFRIRSCRCPRCPP